MADKIEIKNLVKVFPGRPDPVVAIETINLSIPRGQFVCIVGPSGCGKTTLLRIMAGLDKQSYGAVNVIHEDRTKRSNSMIFQEQSIFPWMTVRENISYGLRMRGVDRKTYAPIVDQYILKVGLTRFADSFPYQLSGGMKQRVSIARAFA
ncbi:MAG: ATP-binding cassette domain-containing protein, partial [Betaproteobacteria bacterium]|nr:ATP-binding cassette domain-containing protein [Betaproteobacteria bacterium]